jgi:hypothetical protein
MSAITSRYIETSVVIAVGQTVSGAFPLAEFNAGSLLTPGTIAGTGFTLQVSADGTTFSALQDAAGNAVASVPWTTDENCPIPTEAFKYKTGKIVSQAAQATADRTIKLFLKG